MYALVGNWFSATFVIPHGFANAVGFFLVAFVSEITIHALLRFLASAIFPTQRQFATPWNRINQFLGIFPSLASAFVILSFLFTVIVALPFSPLLKHEVAQAALGKMFLAATQNLEKRIQQVFGGAVLDTLNFITVKPQSDESLQLKFKTTAVSVDGQAEEEMFAMVNKERKAAGLSSVAQDELLRNVSRKHAVDMFAKGYFSHYTPEGRSPFDRMAQAQIPFTFAGENLALAPSVELAMQGLMKSPGHRANILSAQFGRVGIGVIDGGIYGKMFVQEFTD